MVLRRFRVRSSPNLGGRYICSLLTWGGKLLWWLALHRNSYDIIQIVHGRLHAVPAVLAAALLGKPVIIKIGRGGLDQFDLDLVKSKRLLGSWYANTIVRYTTGYISNSREITADLVRWNIATERIHEIPNGVELPLLQDSLPQSGTIRCIYLGRLDPEKSIDLMIRGFAQLDDQSGVSLTIVGDGECRSELEALVIELGLQGSVRFIGAVADVTASLQTADVFVSTSISEGMSNALLEAMSFGLMPLVSDVSGVADMVDDGISGLLFAAGDLAAFTKRLETAVTMPAVARRALGKAARATVEKRFGIDHVAGKHVVLYETFLQ
jgi:glycosyltransferase involved in cell wall biosynthesis